VHCSPEGNVGGVGGVGMSGQWLEADSGWGG